MVAKTRSEARRLIDALDLTAFVTKARKAKTLKWWQVRQAELDYRQFLYLVWLNRQSGNSEFVVPTERADALWHEHILYTANYRSFTNELFGQYLDHFPGLTPGTKEFNRAVTHTRSLKREDSSSGCYAPGYLGGCGGGTSSHSSSHGSHGSSCGSSGSSCGGSGGGCGGGCGG